MLNYYLRYIPGILAIVMGVILLAKPKEVTALYNNWYKAFRIPIKLPEKYTQACGVILIIFGLFLHNIL
jgi:uncharacterized membrane protein HdeD (DUF308 family)